MRYLSDEERQYRIHRALRGMTAHKGEKISKPTVSELSQAALNVLVKAALEIGIWLLTIYEALGLHASQGKAAMDDLIARAFVKLHHLPKGRGGQPVVVEVLQPGLDELNKRGIVPAEKKLKRGGFRHDVYARYLEKWAHAQGYRYWFERTLGQKAFDFVYEDKEGELWAVEICLSGTPEWTAQQIVKGAQVAGVARVIVACERKAFLAAVMTEICKIDDAGVYRHKIMGKLLSEYLRDE